MSMKSFLSIIDRLSDSMKWVGAFFLVTMVIMIVVEVIARYLFLSPLNLGIAYSEIAQALMTALAASWVLVNEKHVVVDLVLGLVPNRVSGILVFINSLLGTIFCGVFSWTAWIMTLRTYNMGERTENWHLPLTPIAVLFSLGFCLFTLGFIRRAIGCWMGLRKGQERRGNHD